MEGGGDGLEEGGRRKMRKGAEGGEGMGKRGLKLREERVGRERMEHGNKKEVNRVREGGGG